MNKEEQFKLLLKEAQALVDSNFDDIANMANLTRLIFDHFPHHWIGFYRVIEQELVLGPFQGPVACTRIGYGKGVCGTSWKEAKSIIVDDVHTFQGHIVCSSLSNSELVIPCKRNNKVFAVLDIDSVEFGAFDKSDQSYFEQLVELL